jgi:hypothetical protein
LANKRAMHVESDGFFKICRISCNLNEIYKY